MHDGDLRWDLVHMIALMVFRWWESSGHAIYRLDLSQAYLRSRGSLNVLEGHCCLFTRVGDFTANHKHFQ